MHIRFSSMLLVFCMSFSCFLLHRCLGNDVAEKERTLAIIKPDGLLGNYTDEIKRTILQSGFVIADEMEIQLREDVVKSFYSEHSAKSFFPHLVDYMTSGPVVIMILEKLNAVADWRALIGPTDASKAKHPSHLWDGFTKKLCSWFRFTTICCQGNSHFIQKDIHRLCPLSM